MKAGRSIKFVLVASIALAASAVRLHADSPSTQAAAAKKIIPAFAAMQYYDDNCAHCHGSGGSFYGPTLGNDLTDAGLIKKCHMMAMGPGNSPTADSENLVVTAYHRALIMRTLFVSVTDIESNQWTGEVSPGAKVTIHAAGRMIQAAVTDWTWTAALPAGVNQTDVKIEVELNGKHTTLDPIVSAYSNTTPLPPPDQRHK